MLWLVGIDEVGRGPLAGPVGVGVAAVPMHAARRLWQRHFHGVKESKQLHHEGRQTWLHTMEERQQAGDLFYAVSMRAAEHIDGHGIAVSIGEALAEALAVVSATIEARGGRVGEIRLDGGLKAPPQYAKQRTIIKGDVKEKIIALASIAAKVHRDTYMMEQAAKRYPHYGFELHKGYGTKVHHEALKKHGMSPEHRRSFIHFL